MKIIDNSLSFVVIGDWNKIYIDPSWIISKILNVDKAEIEITGQGVDYVVRIKSNNIVIQPSQQSTILICSNASDTNIKEFEIVCDTFLKESISPKVTAYGFNIQFEEDDISKYSSIVDAITDTDALTGYGATIEGTEIIRKLSYDNEPYSIAFVIKNGKLNILINSHHDYNNSSDLIDISENTISNFKNSCVNLLASCGYILETED